MNKLTVLALALPISTLPACNDDGDNGQASDTDTSDTESATDTTPTTTMSTTMTSAGTDSTTATTSGSDTDTSGDTDEPPPPECADPDDANAPKMGIDADITTDTTLTCDTIWVLQQLIFVKGATLTIEPGTTIRGLQGSALVIEKDAMIMANGQGNAPIVFTSNMPKGSRNRGDWGGLVLIGDAPINLAGGTGMAEGFPIPPTYGGNDAAHKCGELSYLRVEFAGHEVNPGNELNGITFYACGTDTKIDHLQSHMGSDDGFEWFGGNFNGKYLIASGASDDSFDIDIGYRGKLQFLYAVQDPAEANHAFEWSNQPMDFTATPLTGPTVANATLVGGGSASMASSKGANFKEGNQAYVWSTIFTNFPLEAILLTHPETQAQAQGGGIVLMNNLFFGNNAEEFKTSGMASWDAAAFEAWVKMEASNLFGMDPKLGSVAWGSDDPTPAMDSPAAGAGAVPNDAFFEMTDYIGAVAPGAATDWTHAAWTNYDPS